MVTVRTYWNPIDAAFEKSLLDNYEIRCALLHENSNLYSRGAQFAVPVQLVVDEDDALRAHHILKGDFEKAAEIEPSEHPQDSSDAVDRTRDAINRNPWELLALAFYLLLPAICLVSTKVPADLTGPWARHFMARAIVTQFLSWLAIIFAGVLIAIYFQVRHSARSRSSEPSKGI